MLSERKDQTNEQTDIPKASLYQSGPGGRQAGRQVYHGVTARPTLLLSPASKKKKKKKRQPPTHQPPAPGTPPRTNVACSSKNSPRKPRYEKSQKKKQTLLINRLCDTRNTREGFINIGGAGRERWREPR
jgi:hypothetical protein